MFREQFRTKVYGYDLCFMAKNAWRRIDSSVTHPPPFIAEISVKP